MVRYGQWFDAPRDFRSMVVEVLGVAFAELPRIGIATLMVVVAGAMLAIFCSFGVGIDLTSGGSWAALPNRRRAPKGLAALAPRPSREAEFPVTVRIVDGGAITGLDDGVVVMFEGWFLFEGLRTSFAVRNSDALSLSSKTYELRLVDGRELRIVPYDRLGERKGLRNAFDAIFRRWIRDASPEGRSVLPPRAIHASSRTDLVGKSFVGLVWIGFAFGWAFVGGLFPLLLSVVWAACGLFWMGRSLWGWTRLQRLRT